MNLKKPIFNKIILTSLLVLIPILLILLVVLSRQIITPSNEDIINELRNTKYYSSKVEYVFINSKSEFEENTMHYYSFDKGARIEFQDGYDRVKVYRGGEIKVEGNQDEEYILNKEIDIIYPLAFLENILSNLQSSELSEVKEEWGEGVYLKVDIEYNSKNKHLNKAEFYVDKNKKVPVLLRILDDSNRERVRITYKDFKKEKSLSDELF